MYSIRRHYNFSRFEYLNSDAELKKSCISHKKQVFIKVRCTSMFFFRFITILVSFHGKLKENIGNLSSLHPSVHSALLQSSGDQTISLIFAKFTGYVHINKGST